MSRAALYGVIVALLVGIAAAGAAYYNYKRNTLLEVDVGSHGLTVQRN
jgi:hypothetical protein